MTSIDKLETQVEKLTERIRSLTFEFKNPDVAQQAENLQNDIIASLEEYLELAAQDWENRPQEGEGDDIE